MTGRLFHGTRASLAVGGLVLPCGTAGRCNWSAPRVGRPIPHQHDRVYLTDDPEVALWFAVAASPPGLAKVLTVEPLGYGDRDDLLHQGHVVSEWTAEAALVLRVNVVPDDIAKALAESIGRGVVERPRLEVRS